MKNPPTLADTLIANAASPKKFGGKGRSARESAYNEQVRLFAKSVAAARKFVLDDSMSAYLADLRQAVWRRGQRKRMAALENCRRLSRLPHALTWIEFRFGPFHERLKSLGFKFDVQLFGSTKVEPFDDPTRVGWLFRQHAKIETAFKATEAWTATGTGAWRKHDAIVHPLSISWVSDNAIPPWTRVKLPVEPATFEYEDGRIEPIEDWSETVEAEMIREALQYRCDQVRWAYSFDDEKFNAKMVKDMEDVTFHPIMSPREFWPLLSTLNDLPIKIQMVEPTKGYVVRGSYKRFVTHSIIHLTVPETRWRKLSSILVTALHKRAHQVRGHWRIDWRNRPGRTCDHKWTPKMTCERCGGHYLWIAEHVRGDATLGFVVHDYDITHNKKDKAA